MYDLNCCKMNDKVDEKIFHKIYWGWMIGLMKRFSIKFIGDEWFRFIEDAWFKLLLMHD
jgi:hypothetical protein